MTPDEQILEILQSWAPDVTAFLKQAGYFSMTDVAKEEIANKIGFGPGTRLYNRILAASEEKNTNVWGIVLDVYSLKEFHQGAREIAASLKIPFSKYDWQDLAQTYFDDHGTEFVKNMSDTDLSLLKGQIQENFGLNPAAFADRYGDSYACSESRLERIKRTETHTASEAGANSFAEEAGAKYKVWNCTPIGPWPRPSHRSVWHEKVGIDEAFSNGFMWPSEPNCRCYLTYEF